MGSNDRDQGKKKLCHRRATMRKISVVTSSRAEYGLLRLLISEINNDAQLKLELIVTGSHLSKEHGETYMEIEKEFSITHKVPMELSHDDKLNTCISMSRLQIEMSKVLDSSKPDIVVILGDRYEILSVAISCMMLNIPIAHIHGGETTEGAIDEAIRHSITKMSHIHLCATQAYKKRVLQLGEQPSSVYNVGALGVENIQTLTLLNKKALEESINFTLAEKNVLVTFHPVTLDESSAKEQFQELLDALNKLNDTNIIFTKANADSDGKVINSMIDDYVKNNPKNSIAFTSLGMLRYLSALQFIDAVVGNSSSGIIEAPSFNIATINIGDRQKGREMANSIINVQTDKRKILNAIKKIYSAEFKKLLVNNINPYQSEGTSKTIKEILKNTSLKNILKKSFYDL